ncbi:MAG: rod shape-determining protein MreD [Candidatus Cohnella colombiensis]|uniref:Rod shape-determining protein MreD n=1 Tax=Candidatus Cohnella colombiensis TaxID=3121368 RepID=A0AA95JCM6_9BACL|nr:MAG: rod shape-determining protein MreD [Cohnella sp.]
MRINRVIICTLILILVENAIIPWIIPSQWSDRLFIHFSFIMTIFIAGFDGRHRAFIFGLGFGILQDILFYGHLIGPYGFGMGLLGYLIGLVVERKMFTLGFFVWLVLMGGMLLDTIVYLIYMLFQLTKLNYQYVFFWQIAPTTLLQLIVALAIYVPVRRLLVKATISTNDDSSD